MKAICVTPSRALAVRDIPTPDEAAPGNVLIDMDASAINHGDKTFLKLPNAAGNPFSHGQYNVWGASGAGTVVAIGEGVPETYKGRQVAVYRSLGRSSQNIGLWCERAHIPYSACLILPDHVRARDYCGSLVNVMTAFSFVEEFAEAGHTGLIVTAGNSATGRAMVSMTRNRNLPAIFLVRSEAAKAALGSAGAEHVIVTGQGFENTLGALAAEMNTTAVFDGVGCDLVGTIAPVLPMHTMVYIYGFLGAASPVSIQSAVFMMKNLSIRRFSNFESRTVKEPERLVAALKALEGNIDDPMLRTRIGKEFHYEEIDDAMAYESREGAKAILIGSGA